MGVHVFDEDDLAPCEQRQNLGLRELIP